MIRIRRWTADRASAGKKRGHLAGNGVWTKTDAAKDGEELLLSCSSEEYETLWRRYFDIDTDYPAIRQELSQLDPILAKASTYAGGIRILQQEPWEALCSFIISQNNNIPVSKESSRGSVKPRRAFRRRAVPFPLSPAPCRFFSGRTGPSARRIPGQIPAVRCPPGDGRKGGFAGHSRNGDRKGSGNPDAHSRRRSKSGGMRLALWLPPAGSFSHGCLDEAGHGAMVPGQNPGGFRPLCRHCTAISLSLYTDL